MAKKDTQKPQNMSSRPSEPPIKGVIIDEAPGSVPMTPATQQRLKELLAKPGGGTELRASVDAAVARQDAEMERTGVPEDTRIPARGEDPMRATIGGVSAVKVLTEAAAFNATVVDPSGWSGPAGMEGEGPPGGRGEQAGVLLHENMPTQQDPSLETPDVSGRFVYMGPTGAATRMRTEPTPTMGRVAFEAYGDHPGPHGAWKTFDGRPIPRWDSLAAGKNDDGTPNPGGPLTLERWDVAVEAVFQAIGLTEIFTALQDYRLPGEKPAETLARVLRGQLLVDSLVENPKAFAVMLVVREVKPERYDAVLVTNDRGRALAQQLVEDGPWSHVKEEVAKHLPTSMTPRAFQE